MNSLQSSARNDLATASLNSYCIWRELRIYHGIVAYGASDTGCYLRIADVLATWKARNNPFLCAQPYPALILSASLAIELSEVIVLRLRWHYEIS
jgi:hypothetical protein